MRAKEASVWIAAGLVVLVAGGFWLHRRKPQPAPRPAPAPDLVVPSQVTLNGKVRAAHVTPVTTQVPGSIDSFEANVGDEVYQGQVLARIGSSGLESERAEAAAGVEKARNRVEESEKAVTSAQLEASRAHADAERSRLALDRAGKVFDRQKTLFQAGATPRLTYEKAASDFESASQEWDAVDKAQRAAAGRVQDTMKQLDNAKRLLAARSEELEGAESAVASGVLESPVDGLVVARQGELGQPVAELRGELFQIATDLYDLEVAVEPSPEIRKRMRPHEPALVIIPDLQSTGYPGEVKQFLDNQVIIGFSSPTPAIRPGMVAEVRLHPE